MIFFTSFKYLQIFFVLSTGTIFLTTREITLLKNVKKILIILESNRECADGLVTDITKVTTGIYIYNRYLFSNPVSCILREPHRWCNG
jgi:hypothetical protein